MSTPQIVSPTPETLSGAAPPFKTSKDKWSGTTTARELTETHIVPYPAWFGEDPGIGNLHPVYDWLELEKCSCSQDERNGNRARMVLKWKQFEFDAGEALPPLPADECDKNANVIEIDIRRHPKFETPNPGWTNLALSDFYDFGNERIFAEATIPTEFQDSDGKTKGHEQAGEEVPLEIRGMSRYVVGSGVVHCRTYSYNAPPNVFLRAGQRAVPPAFPGGSDLNWLIVSASETQEGGFFVWEEVYQLSMRAISPWVYDAVS